MPNYYETVGVRPDIPQDAIKKALEAYSLRLKQMGTWASEADHYREIEKTLTDWERRKAYNVQHKIPLPGEAYSHMTTRKAKGAPVEVKKKKKSTLRSREVLIPALVVAILILAFYWGFFFWDQFRSYPEGAYLIDKQSGEVVALILDREENHPFPEGSQPRLEIVMIKSGKHLLVAESQVRPTMKPDAPVPSDIMQAAEKNSIR